MVKVTVECALGVDWMANGPSRAVAALQGLAALGLPVNVAFPEFVRLLGDVAPFETAGMLWLDPDCRPVDVFIAMDCAPPVLFRYATHWFDAEEGRFHPRQSAIQADPALQVLRVSDYTPDFGRTELYDEIYRPARHHWIAALALRDGSRPIGNLGLGRPPGLPDFSDEDIRLLKLARPYVVQGLARSNELMSWPKEDQEDETALLVIDRLGRFVHASPGAWRLLHGAAGAPADLKLLSDSVYAWARPMLQRLAERVLGALHGEPGPPARFDAVTAYGRFVVRAYAFDADPAPKLFGVQIERRLPLEVKMFRSPIFRALTPREQDIARMLPGRLSYPQIASRLGLGPSTVVTHVRNLADKLSVASREEIVAALCG
jgi:DNA-binding CsgD family transcriptional regulator